MKKATQIEQEIVAIVDSLAGELVEVTKDLIGAASENPPGDERAVATVVRDHLSADGLEVEWVAAKPERVNTLGLMKGFGKGRNLLLSGHYDTVPTGNKLFWSTDPLVGVVKDGKIYGRGSCDMKGGVAAAMIGARALARAKVKLRGNLHIHAVADEEPGSEFGTRYLIRSGHESRELMDMAVVAEGSVYKDRVYVRPSVRGYQLLKVIVTGRAHHSSRPHEGINAVLKMSKILQAIDAHRFKHQNHPLLPPPTIAAGTLIKGGTGENIVPEHCEAICDIRIVPGTTGENVLDEVRGIIERLDDPEICADVSSVFYWPPGEVAMTDPICQIAQRVTPIVTGYPLEPIGTEGSNDSCWLNNLAGIPSIAFGPGDNYMSGEHGPDEWVSVARLIDFAKIYALMAIAVCGVMKSG